MFATFEFFSPWIIKTYVARTFLHGDVSCRKCVRSACRTHVSCVFLRIWHVSVSCPFQCCRVHAWIETANLIFFLKPSFLLFIFFKRIPYRVMSKSFRIYCIGVSMLYCVHVALKHVRSLHIWFLYMVTFDINLQSFSCSFFLFPFYEKVVPEFPYSIFVFYQNPRWV